MAEKGSQDKSEAAKREEQVLEFWRFNKIFEKSVAKDAPKGDFTFYEGPPTANGKPGIHHLEARAFKDAIPRYKTMRGYRVARRAGWDTHGLPVELEVEKKLGFSGKPDIEKYGIAEFNKQCRESVLAYIGLWWKFTERIGYWVDAKTAYFTFDAPYMESLWAIVKKVSDDGRLVKDYKVLPWCARCGTALSSHELAQGYEDVKDLSVTAKFKVKNPGKHGLPEDTYLLAWTTTPWTLPGNVALAVGSDVKYQLTDVGAQAKNESGHYLVAEARMIVLEEKIEKKEKGPFEIEKFFYGKDLIGIEYEPLFDIPDLKSDKSYQVYAADFVTTDDGTGIVHTAVMYGADDFTLGSQVGLPKVHTVGADGKFLPNTPKFLAGRSVKERDNDGVAVDIIKDLAHRGLLFAKEKYEHSYPFCWRCKTPLIYYARDSWYVRMTDLRDELLAENKKIHWEPEHIQDGRMGEWLAGVKDWAISRERYWGTPLPVWMAEDGERIVVGSVDDIRAYAKKSGNTYIVMRHGEAASNEGNWINDDNSKENHLTEKGKAEAHTAADKLATPDLIFHSPLARAKETAEIAREHFGLAKDACVEDERLREIGLGKFNNGPRDAFLKAFPTFESRFDSEGVESWRAIRKRMGEFLYEVDKKYTGKRILIVTHDTPGFLLESVAHGHSFAEALGRRPATEGDLHFDLAEARPLDFAPLPMNGDYELDLHRPYIDDVVLEKDGKEFRRVKEVMDVWFDSGAMPFAQDHYLAEKDMKRIAYPADYICEAIDQTRGWFYTLLAVGVLMGRGTSYKNVISLGHLLDAEGKKMSKSRGNVVDPWTAMEQWGADTLRFWMYSVNQPGDSKNFDEKTVREASRVISWLDNSAKFYDLFKDTELVAGESQAIDRWVEARTNETIHTMTEAMDGYRPYDATRALASLIEDLSQWYVRRIRERVRAGDKAAHETLRATLKTCALLIAPFSPFIAEDVYRRVRDESEPESVHLDDWPETKGNLIWRLIGAAVSADAIVADMAKVRALVSKALEARDRAGIKVRQPLRKLTIKNANFSDELLDVIRDEVNVKEVVQAEIESDVELDTEITPELKEEGIVRDAVRLVQEARKAAQLKPGEAGKVTVTIPPESREVVERNLAAIQKQTDTTVTLA